MTRLLFLLVCSLGVTLVAQSASTKTEDFRSLVKQLGSSEYRERKQAMDQMKAIVDQKKTAARKPLEAALSNAKDPEIRSRLALLLRRVEGIERQELLKQLGRAEVHAVGVYQATTNGTVEVRVRKSNKPIILVLTAYRSVRWKVKPEKGSKIVKVIMGGYYEQSVEGVRAIQEQYSYHPRQRIIRGKRRVYFYAYRNSKTDYNYKRMEREVRNLTGKSIKTFQGSYRPPTTPFTVKP